MNKPWITQAEAWLEASRKPLPHETNKLDWKSRLSDNRDRLTEHLIAFANHPNGGCLVYGVTNPDAKLVGVKPDEVASIISKLTNLARDAIEPSLILDHVFITIENVPLLFVKIPESSNKPVHRPAVNLYKKLGYVQVVPLVKLHVKKLVDYYCIANNPVGKNYALLHYLTLI